MVHKPERWAVNAAEVAREWQWAWRDLLGIWSLDPFAFDPLGTGLASGVQPSAAVSPYGTVAQFSGSQRLSATSPAFDLNDRSKMTMYAVATKDSGTAESAIFRNEQVSGGSDDNWFSLVWSENGGAGQYRFPRVEVRDGGGTFRSVYGSETPYGDWVTIVGRFDDGVLDLWVDGEYQGGTTGAGLLYDPATNPPIINIGWWNNVGTPSNYLNGKIAICGAWNRALSLTEVAHLSRDPFGPIRPRRLTPADVTPGSDPFRTKVFVP